jgi:hypothetical protein
MTFCLITSQYAEFCSIATSLQLLRNYIESSWNVMAHGDARERKWRGNWRMEWVASTLHTTSERHVSSITTADAHTSAASSRLNRRPRRFKWTRLFRRKDEIWFLRVCHHISNAVYQIQRSKMLNTIRLKARDKTGLQQEQRVLTSFNFLIPRL